ncbi:MAG: hypothetical protein ACRELB_14560, partial [Polyangiaceae bacterium]
MAVAYSARTMRRWAPRAVLAGVLAVGVARAATASRPAGTQPMDAAMAHRAYSELVAKERTMRREAALKFPGDPWSADDDFHQREQDDVRNFAGHQGVPIGDVLAA